MDARQRVHVVARALTDVPGLRLRLLVHWRRAGRRIPVGVCARVERRRTGIHRVDILRGARIGTAAVICLGVVIRVGTPAGHRRPVGRDAHCRSRRQRQLVFLVRRRTVLTVHILRLAQTGIRVVQRTVDIGRGVGVVMELRRARIDRVQRHVRLVVGHKELIRRRRRLGRRVDSRCPAVQRRESAVRIVGQIAVCRQRIAAAVTVIRLCIQRRAAELVRDRVGLRRPLRVDRRGAGGGILIPLIGGGRTVRVVVLRAGAGLVPVVTAEGVARHRRHGHVGGRHHSVIGRGNARCSAACRRRARRVARTRVALAVEVDRVGLRRPLREQSFRDRGVGHFVRTEHIRRGAVIRIGRAGGRGRRRSERVPFHERIAGLGEAVFGHGDGPVRAGRRDARVSRAGKRGRTGDVIIFRRVAGEIVLIERGIVRAAAGVGIAVILQRQRASIQTIQTHLRTRRTALGRCE